MKRPVYQSLARLSVLSWAQGQSRLLASQSMGEIDLSLKASQHCTFSVQSIPECLAVITATLHTQLEPNKPCYR